MASSQELATAAALTELHIPYQTQVEVLSTVPGYPASKSLKAGDVITAVDGQPVTGETSLTSMITAHPAGTVLQLEVLRSGQTLTVPVTSKSSNGTPVIGISVEQQYKFPFNVNISVGNIGGPSAGMMFALGIIDKLTPDNLTGGKFIAGTGEITGVRPGGADRRHPAEDGGRPRRPARPSSSPPRATAPTRRARCPPGCGS